MAKNTTPFSYKNVTYSISTLHLEAIAQAKFNEPFAEHKEEVKEFVRSLLKDKNKVSAQIIEDTIFLHFLPKKVQKRLV